MHTLNSTYLEPGAGDPAGTEMDRDQVNGYMSKNILKFKKCCENRGAGERVAGQGAASEEEVLQWYQSLRNPREEHPRQREQ